MPIPLTLPFFDAGIDCNLPWSVAAVEERKIDVIVALDSSDDVFGNQGYLTLQGLNRKRQQEIDRTGHSRLPEAKFCENMDSKRVFVFGDSAKDEIVIVYIPTKNPPTMDDWITEAMGVSGFCNVTNFSYSEEQFDKLCDLSKSNMRYHHETIKQVIAAVAKQKRGKN